MESSIPSEVNDTSILRTGFSIPLSLSSQLSTGLSAPAPAQRAGAQRLCALALLGLAGCTRQCPIIEGEADSCRERLMLESDPERRVNWPGRNPA
jgi:hypothetical protein